jgi:hypothetical protein
MSANWEIITTVDGGLTAMLANIHQFAMPFI